MQEVDSYRDLMRSLHAGAVAADVASPPIDPSRFSAPLAVTWMTGFLIGQTILGWQLVIIRLAVPHSSASWGAVSFAVAAVYCAAGFAMARPHWFDIRGRRTSSAGARFVAPLL